MIRWPAVLQSRPLIAILRGLAPAQAGEVAEALVDSGFLCLEIPLNSPQPLESLKIMAARVGTRALVGAGTVLTPLEARQAIEAGARLVISPNANPDVIRAAKAGGAISIPGIFTATEAFAALSAGADALKLFPAEATSPVVVRALRAVLPEAAIFPVGGVTPSSMGDWIAAGASGFGIGSALYRPGITIEQLAANAQTFVKAYERERHSS